MAEKQVVSFPKGGDAPDKVRGSGMTDEQVVH